MNNKNLKQGKVSTKTSKKPFGRYIIETVQDLNAFRKAFPQIKDFNVYNNMLEDISVGRVIIATDPHPLTGMPTYCFASESFESHPTNIVIVKQ